MKNRIYIIVVILLLLSLFSERALCSQSQQDDEAIIRNAIARQLRKEEKELTTEDYINLRYLNLSNTKVSNIESISTLTNLQSLSLINTPISDIKPLSELICLGRLYLSHTQVDDINSLSGLTKLQELGLDFANVNNIGPLAKLENLLKLNLSRTQISDINSLSGLKNLQELNLFRTQVDDISPLSNLTNLQELNLYGTEVSDINPLSKLAKLQSLILTDTQVSDINPLKSLTNLQTLHLGNTKVSNIETLSGLTKLKSLFLYNTKVSDINSLSNLTELQSLLLEETQISDVRPLSRLTNLQRLNLSNTQVGNITPLSGLINLETLDLSRTHVRDINSLYTLANLQSLWIYDTQVYEEQIAELKKALPNLQIHRTIKTEINEEVERDIIYSGEVIDAQGNPIEGASLHILRRPRFKAMSGQGGIYKLTLGTSTFPETHEIYIIARHEEKNLAAAIKVPHHTQTQDITLMPAVSVTGVITDSNGNPIENAEINCSFPTTKYITSFAEQRLFYTDSQGVYKIPCIPRRQKHYYLSFSAKGYGAERIPVTLDDKVDSVIEIDTVVLFNANETISGIIVDSDGNPVPNAQIFPKGEHQPKGFTPSNSDGTFTIFVHKGDVFLDVVARKNGKFLAGQATQVPSGTNNVKIVLEPVTD